jgi:hypothetical protein
MSRKRRGYSVLILLRGIALLGVILFVSDLLKFFSSQSSPPGILTRSFFGGWFAVKATTYYFAVFLLILAFNKSRETRLLLGSTSPQVSKFMRAVSELAVSGPKILRGRTNLVYLGLAAGGASVLFSTTEPLCFLALAVARLLWLRVRIGTSPVMLYLATGGRKSTARHAGLQEPLRPLRVVALLPIVEFASDYLMSGLELDCLYLPGRDDWREVAFPLIQEAPLIVLDCSPISEGVIAEAEYIRDNNLEHKCIFITSNVKDCELLGAVWKRRPTVCLLKITELEPVIWKIIDSREFPSETRPMVAIAADAVQSRPLR